MLALLTPFLGFLAPFLPEVIKFFQRSQDNKHELEMFQLRLSEAAADHTYKMDEINATADITEMTALHQSQTSYGIEMLDKAHDTNMPQWSLIPAFWMYALLDAGNMLVRPLITYAAVAFYMFYRYACYETAKAVVTNDTTWNMIVTSLWNDNDWGVLLLVLAYWFGERTRKAVFGGSKA